MIATASPGDAVTGQALAWRRALARHDIDGEVFAEYVMPELRGHVRSLQSFSPHPQAATMLHYSIWSEVVERALALPPERLAVCYHNITPAHYLEGVNPVVAALCSRGRRGLVRLAGRVRVAIADSPFNAEELEANGIDEVSVVPLLFWGNFHDRSQALRLVDDINRHLGTFREKPKTLADLAVVGFLDIRRFPLSCCVRRCKFCPRLMRPRRCRRRWR